MDRKDLYRLTQALGAHFVASYPEPPAAIVLDLDHTDDPTHGQQEFAFYNHYYKNYCYLPLLIFEGLSGALVTAGLRPGTRPTGAENAMILVRLLAFLRRHWPRTHILVRGDSHFATPEVIEVLAHRHLIDFVFGLAGNPVLLRHAEPVLQERGAVCTSSGLPSRRPITHALPTAAVSMPSLPMVPPPGPSHGGSSSRRK